MTFPMRSLRPGASVHLSAGDGLEPVAAEVLRMREVGCDGCGLPVYRCRTELGIEYDFCLSIIHGVDETTA